MFAERDRIGEGIFGESNDGLFALWLGGDESLFVWEPRGEEGIGCLKREDQAR